ncbi:LytR/AlgR family response regulator transcription factor [Hymenobacter weizhouensis]|uniref:LytR/AlgR family response regulator transcription factor n=1 Tax=Hymenobacter sp. YIM 151500-1 TaxID=2987689 RepID=UPI00222630AB|nr:LytTR family DNA-binding domain-containing protein [Hymenobacter sp. YIM 151500-1]UYZ64455.1 LytTR family DNA-binding domain-containing protein [Hymenobacter sp. YIM 151500-1]
MKLLLIEDEYPAAERLQRLLRQADPAAEVLGVVRSVAAGRQWFQDNPPPDLILSDIQLADGLSFEIFDHVGLTSPIIFTTSYDEYAIKAFRVRSVDYLLKPIKLTELRAALAKYHDLRAAFSPVAGSQRLERLLDSLPLTGRPYKTRFLVASGEQLLPIDVEQIAYFQTRNELVYLVTRDGRRFVIDYPLEQLERLLDPQQFFRASRQLLTHLSAVHRLHPYFNGKLKLDLHPESAEEALISRDKAGAFKAWLEGELPVAKAVRSGL